jgi:hypothetical protein
MSDYENVKWEQGARGPNNCPIVGNGRGRMICMLGANADEYPEYEDHAQLITAAPELLDALLELVDLVNDHRDGGYTFDSFSLQPAESAIRKATTPLANIRYSYK